MIKKILRSKIFKLVLIIVLAFAGFTVYKTVKGKKAAAQTSNLTFVRTVTLSKGSLDETVSSSGKIESSKVSNVTTNLKYEVKGIYVQVGDAVKAGDSIVQLDTSEIDKQITKLQNSDAESLETLKENYNNAVESKDAVWVKFATAQSDKEEAESALSTASSRLKKVKSEVDTYQQVYDDAAKELETATKNANNAYDEWLKASEEEMDAKETAYHEAEEIMQAKKAAADTAKQELESAKSNTGYSIAESNYSQAQSAYEKASSTYDNYNDQLSSANAKVEEAKKKLEEGVSSDSLEDLYESKENCTLKAKTDGVVTSLNATVGSMVSESTVATIQAINTLQISLSLDEYDIQKVKTGMNATVTSDAINETFDAVVTQIDPIATSSQNSSSFGVTVTITSKDVTGLKVGMSAKVEIIISSTADVYTVPVDAIETKEDGKTVIYVKNSNGDFDEVEVNVGQQTDYYAEISGNDLREGMAVRASANEDEASVNVDANEAGVMPDMGGSGFGGQSGGGFSGGPSGGGFSGGAPSGGPGMSGN